MKHGIMPVGFVERAAATAAQAAEGPYHVPADGPRRLDRAARASRRSIRVPARRCPPPGARRGPLPVVARRPPGGMTSSRCSNAPRQRSRPRWRSSGRCTPPRGRAGSTCGFEWPASRASRAHRYRLRRPLGSRGRAHLLRGAWAPPIPSSAVRAAVIESLPEGVGRSSLGAWRFRGLPEPVDLFQVDAADRPADSRHRDRPPPPSSGLHRRACKCQRHDRQNSACASARTGRARPRGRSVPPGCPRQSSRQRRLGRLVAHGSGSRANSGATATRTGCWRPGSVRRPRSLPRRWRYHGAPDGQNARPASRRRPRPRPAAWRPPARHRPRTRRVGSSRASTARARPAAIGTAV